MSVNDILDEKELGKIYRVFTGCEIKKKISFRNCLEFFRNIMVMRVFVRFSVFHVDRFVMKFKRNEF